MMLVSHFFKSMEI